MDILLHLLDDHVPNEMGKIICRYAEFKIVEKLWSSNLSYDGFPTAPEMKWSIRNKRWIRDDIKRNKLIHASKMECGDNMYTLDYVDDTSNYFYITQHNTKLNRMTRFDTFKIDNEYGISFIPIPPDSKPTHVDLLVKHGNRNLQKENYFLYRERSISIIRIDISGEHRNAEFIPWNFADGHEWIGLDRCYKDHNGDLFGWIYNKTNDNFDWTRLVSAYFIQGNM